MKDKLHEIFTHQRHLMERFHRVEKRNGLLLTERTPVDLQSFLGQARLRDYAWRFVEEIGEALHAKEGVERQEELADALHFLVELCISANMDSAQIVPGFEPEAGDRLDRLMNGTSPEAHTSAEAFEIDELALALIKHLTMTINLLSNRPWKQKKRSVSPLVFQEEMTQVFRRFGFLCACAGFTAETLYDAYFKKAGINHQRINEGT